MADHCGSTDRITGKSCVGLVSYRITIALLTNCVTDKYPLMLFGLLGLSQTLHCYMGTFCLGDPVSVC